MMLSLPGATSNAIKQNARTIITRREVLILERGNDDDAGDDYNIKQLLQEGKFWSWNVVIDDDTGDD